MWRARHACLILLVAWLGAALVRPVSAARRRKAPAPSRTTAQAKRWMARMPLRERVAQLVVIPFYGEAPNARTREYARFMRLVRETRVGGLVLLNRVQNRMVKRAEPYALAAFLNRMQRLAAVPLIVAGDFERGPSMRVEGAAPFPHAMALAATGDPATTRLMGEVTAREARALGVQWLLVPVADVNNNPDNPVINIRSFGEDPADVSAHVKAFLEGARAGEKSGVLTTVKHFPGHGDTATDTHQSLASVGGDRARLDAVELAPFKAAIAAGVDAVMSAHVSVPALDAPDLPATLSPAILTQLLRQEMGFQGLIVTDALEMGGVAKGFKNGETAVRAIEAGADILLMPPDPDAAINAVVAAVQQGRITRARIDRSVEKLLAAKERLGLGRQRLVSVEAVSDAIDDPDVLERVQEIAGRAVTLVRNEERFVPVAPDSGACYLALSENVRSPQGAALLDVVRRRAPARPSLLLNADMTEAEIDQSLARLPGCEKFAVFAFASSSSYRNGTAPLPGSFPRVVESLISSGKPVLLASLGNPYLMRAFPGVKAYLTTYSTVVPAEVAAARAVFGEIAIGGRLPVTIPGLASKGSGIRLAAVPHN